MDTTFVALVFGVPLALAFITLGTLLRYCKMHGLIPSYARSAPDEQELYDIEGLGNHLGNGWMTLGMLALASSVLLSLELTTAAYVTVALAGGVILIMVIGAPKFMPAGQHPPPGCSRHTVHRFCKWLMSERAYRSMETGTRHWLVECPCGHTQDYWDAGGIRWKAAGNPRQWGSCPACEQTRWHLVRKKQPGELGGPGGKPETCCEVPEPQSEAATQP